MASSSSEKIAFTQRLGNVVLAFGDDSSAHQRSRKEIKELQRRAYERGVTVERKAWGERCEKLLSDLDQALTEHRRQREADRKAIEEFAVRLALTVAEDLVGRTVENGEHRLREMVTSLLEEVDADAQGEPLELRLNPADHAQILEAVASGDFVGDLTFMADPEVESASFVLNGGDVSYYALLSERIETLRQRMIEESRHGAT